MNEKKLEVLVAAMNQKDLSIVDKMNIQCNTLIANQCDREEFISCISEKNTIRMISTKTRGVGTNRNIALTFSQGDILLFADEDCVYEKGTLEEVIRAFEKLPQADVILFGNQYSKNGEVYKVRKVKTRKLPFIESLKFGTYVIAIRRKTLLKHHLNFSELFGGGCLYSHGEDSDFIIQCYKKRLKIYSYNIILCTTAKDYSTCFVEHNEKYFYDTGALAKHSFAFFAKPYMLYMAWRIRNETDLSYWQRVRYLKAGYKSFSDLLGYEDWGCKV